MLNITPFEKRNYDLFNVMDDFDRMMFGNPRSASGKCFCTDIRDENDKYVLEAELPGFAKEDIKIEVADDYLTISAEHTEKKDEKDDKGKYLRRERTYGSFSRSFTISDVDAAAVEAEYADGILRLTMPKKQEETPAVRRLEIH